MWSSVVCTSENAALADTAAHRDVKSSIYWVELRTMGLDFWPHLTASSHLCDVQGTSRFQFYFFMKPSLILCGFCGLSYFWNCLAFTVLLILPLSFLWTCHNLWLKSSPFHVGFWKILTGTPASDVHLWPSTPLPVSPSLWQRDYSKIQSHACKSLI